ncbi:MAG: formylglycine-generating enzyme family protein [Myxococcaceae bacterium]|nr:formylglycine-generating enzyme family protein [Myxococcaceae bacterium]
MSLLAMVVVAAPVFAGAVADLPSGRFAPLYGLDVGQTSFPVRAFRLDVRPVSRADFAAFLSEVPRWRQGAVPPALADARYLATFAASKNPAAPVTEVSYFAARAYCSWRHGRLPTTLEWEYAAAADETRRDASQDGDFVQRILDWYGQPAREGDLDGPGSPRNVYGVEALHGLVWEWTEDFNALFVTGDNRQDGDISKRFLCGAGATGSARREDYAAFMRYAMRSSLEARSVLPRLGFRCAYDDVGRSP